MKIRLAFKTPDVGEYTDPPLEDMSEEDREMAKNAIEQWVEYGENLTVEIDTETGECTPIKVK